MTFRIEYNPAAVAEARSAREWYEARSASSADAFVKELDEAIEQIGRWPDRWPKYTRGYLLRKFSFSVVYRKLAGSIQKAARNLRKHRVSFHEAATVFGDPLGATAADPDHSVDEHRYITVGLSNRSRLPMVAHTERHGRTRIISARSLTPGEREAYEETRL